MLGFFAIEKKSVAGEKSCCESSWETRKQSAVISADSNVAFHLRHNEWTSQMTVKDVQGIQANATFLVGRD